MRLIPRVIVLGGATLITLPALAACGKGPTPPASAGHPPALTHHRAVSHAPGSAQASNRTATPPAQPLSGQAAIHAAMAFLAKKTAVPLWAPQATAIHSFVLTGHKLSVTASGSVDQYQVGLIATARSYPINSPHIDESAFGINTVLGGFGGHRYASETAAQAALQSSAYQSPPTSPPSRIALTARLHADQWISHGHVDIIEWHQKGWLVQVNQLVTVQLAREVAQAMARTGLPAAHGVIVVGGATDGAGTSVAWRVGATDYRVFGRPDSADTIEMAGSMRAVLGLATSANTPTPSRTRLASPSWTYAMFTNHGPNGSFTMRIPQQFTAQAPPTDHDGRTWTHGSATITAFSEINATHARLAYPLSRQTAHVNL
ncbi:hypothetical protein [Sulfobacillus harzensis]|uniref:Uncharacterized protein n=1 Tax=Sulfobacillus harzensis TaxID=2729629 RepID=A0A7Y0Q4T4_9FIRM|nr:hypothetical protein [Sulfobacillus harzensis]NMP24947.1 hypothetical protein [Sulfobacillus harzensis]